MVWHRSRQNQSIFFISELFKYLSKVDGRQSQSTSSFDFFLLLHFYKRLWHYMVINLWWFSFQFIVLSVNRLTDKLIFFAAKKKQLLNHFAQSLLLASLFLLFSPPTTCIILVNLICPLALMNRNNQNWPHVRLCWEMTKRESHRKEFTFIHKLILKLQIQGV